MMKLSFLPFLPLIIGFLCHAQDKTPNPSEAIEQTSPIVKSVNKLGLEILLFQLKDDPNGNYCVCPLPIASITSTLAEGATGETKTQLLKPFGEIEHPFIEISKLSENMSQQGIMKFTGFFNNSKYPLKKTYQERIEKTNITSFYQIDVSKNGIEKSRDRINQIIAKQTKSKITHFISPRMINPEFALIIADTVYMNSAWSCPFEYYTTKKSFFPGKSVPPSKGTMMHDPQAKTFLIQQNQTLYWKNYKDSDLRMIAVLPPINEDPASFLASAKPEEWLSLSSEQEKKTGESGNLDSETPPLEVIFPKFALSTPVVELNKFMKTQGIEDCFVKGKADLSPMTGEGNLNPWYVDKVFQKTSIQMDKDGTLAVSAASAMVDPFCGSLPTIIQFNRPFVYCIIDTKTGAVLFLGVINNPFEKNKSH